MGTRRNRHGTRTPLLYGFASYSFIDGRSSSISLPRTINTAALTMAPRNCACGEIRLMAKIPRHGSLTGNGKERVCSVRRCCKSSPTTGVPPRNPICLGFKGALEPAKAESTRRRRRRRRAFETRTVELMK